MVATEIGVVTWLVDQGVGICDLARAIEDAGLESLFVVEHTHVPASRRDLLDDPRHKMDSHLLDPFTVLGAAAAVTSRLNLGTGVCVAVQHDPIILAKQVASLDFVSGGRFLFGVGVGWLTEEMVNLGVDPVSRWRRLREQVLAMKAIWAEDEAEFHGQFVDFDPIWLWPKPVQRPHPPVLVGANGPGALRRVVDYGDGWMPIVTATEAPTSGRAVTASTLEPLLAELDRLSAEADRDPVPVTASLWEIDEALIERCAELGVARCAVVSPIGDLAVVQPFLDRCSKIARRLHG